MSSTRALATQLGLRRDTVAADGHVVPEAHSIPHCGSQSSAATLSARPRRPAIRALGDLLSFLDDRKGVSALRRVPDVSRALVHISRLGATLLLAGAACSAPVASTEVLRVPSPDASVDAVVEQTDAGATTAPGYLISFPAHGCAPGDAVLRVVGATRSSSGYGVAVRWDGPRAVTVAYLDARFTDPATTPFTAATLAGPVSVTLHPGVVDPSAPSGTMPPRPGPSPAC